MSVVNRANESSSLCCGGLFSCWIPLVVYLGVADEDEGEDCHSQQPQSRGHVRIGLIVVFKPS